MKKKTMAEIRPEVERPECPGETATALDMADLLTIDYGAEVRKLALGGLEGPWQVPAELVRLALRRGARRVTLSLGRGRLSLSHDGRAFDTEDLQALGVLLDDKAAGHEKHRAYVRLEAPVHTGLAALAALRPSRLALVSAGARLLAHRGERSNLLVRDPLPATPQGHDSPAQVTQIDVRGLRLNTVRARAWLHTACRFAPVPVTLDGDDLARGFERSLGESAIETPVKGRVGLPLLGHAHGRFRRHRDPRLHLHPHPHLHRGRLFVVEHGVLSAHLSVPDVPGFEAVIDGARLTPEGSSASALRAAVEPHVAAIVDCAVGLWLALAARLALLSLHHDERRQVRHALLLAARKRLRLGEVLAVPAFAAVAASPPREWLVSLRELGERGGRGALYVLHPGQDPEEFVLDTPAIVLDAEERSRLSELFGTQFVPPRRREPSRSRLRRALEGLHTLPCRAHRRLLRWAHGRSRALSEHEWSVQERALRDGLRAWLPREADGTPAIPTLASGSGPVHTTRAPARRLWLPRKNRAVRAALTAVTRDARWAYAATIALLDEAGATASEWPSKPHQRRRSPP